MFAVGTVRFGTEIRKDRLLNASEVTDRAKVLCFSRIVLRGISRILIWRRFIACGDCETRNVIKNGGRGILQN
jgi:hypothetical protein